MDELQQVNRHFHERGHEPGAAIYYAGDPASQLYVLAAGSVKLIRHTLAGHDVLLDILATGEFFGSLSLLGDETYSDTALAQTITCTLSISGEDFRKLLEAYPQMAITVLDITTARLRDAQETIQQLSASSAEQRIASALLKLGEKLGEPREMGLLIQIPLTREDLAAMTGTTPETVSRIMAQLQKAGLVETGRQWVAIANQEKLAEVAQGGG
jgi:CRP-like cAMP-binding protein